MAAIVCLDAGDIHSPFDRFAGPTDVSFAMHVTQLTVVMSFILTVASISCSAPPPTVQEPAPLTPVETAPRPLEFLGQIGGRTTTMALHGSTLVFDLGPRLAVADVSNLSAPRVLALSDVLPDEIRDIALVWPYAYVASSTAGLRIFDVADASEAKQVSAITDSRVDMVLASGTILYTFGADSGLTVFDLTVLTSPVRLASAEVGRTGTAPSRMALNWPNLYVPAGYAGLLVFDVSDARSPSQIGRFFTPSRDPVGRGTSEAGSVALTDGYAYVAWVRHAASVYATKGISIVDVSNPSELSEVGFMGSEAPRVAVQGSYLFVTGPGSSGIYNIGDPQKPERVYSRPSPRSEAIDALIEREGTGYVVANRLLEILDLSNLAAPVTLGSTSTVGSVISVVLDGPTVYRVGSILGYEVLDVSDPAKPKALRYVDYVDESNNPGLSVDDKYLYRRAARSLTVWARNGTSMPPLVATVTDLGISDMADAEFRWPYMVSWTARELTVWDLSSGTPIHIGVLQASRDASWEVWLSRSGRRAYVGISSRETFRYMLGIVDLSDPRDPRMLSTFETASISKLAATDTHIYADTRRGTGASENRGVIVWDVSDPSRLDEKAFIPMLSVLDFVLSDQYLLVAGSSAEPLYIVDIRDPSHVSAVPYTVPYDPPRWPPSWSMQGDRVYLTAMRAGLFIYRIPSG
jgi:hypothetical protein